MHFWELEDGVREQYTIDRQREKIERLQGENAKLQEAFNETLVRLSAANEAAGGGFMDARYCKLLHELGIEVGND